MTSSSRKGTNSSTPRRSSASSTDSTRSTGRSVRIPGPYAEGPPPKRRRVIGSLNPNRDSDRTYVPLYFGHRVNCPVGIQSASVNRAGTRRFHGYPDLFDDGEAPGNFPGSSIPMFFWTPNMSNENRVRPSDQSSLYDSWFTHYNVDQFERAKSERFVRDFARWRMHPDRGYGRMHRDSRSNWIENGGGLVGEPRKRPAHRARKPARPVRNRSS